jgi:hypothetical protein
MQIICRFFSVALFFVGWLCVVVGAWMVGLVGWLWVEFGWLVWLLCCWCLVWLVGWFVGFTVGLLWLAAMAMADGWLVGFHCFGWLCGWLVWFGRCVAGAFLSV